MALFFRPDNFVVVAFFAFILFIGCLSHTTVFALFATTHKMATNEYSIQLKTFTAIGRRCSFGFCSLVLCLCLCVSVEKNKLSPTISSYFRLILFFFLSKHRIVSH